MFQMKVFPAYAGVILIVNQIEHGNDCIPRVCRGDSEKLSPEAEVVQYSPRMQG